MPLQRLAELCEKSIDYFRPDNWPEDSFTYVDVSAVDSVAKQIVNVKRVLVSQAPSRAQQILKCGDIIVSNVRPNMNAVAQVSPEFDGTICSSAFTVLRCTARLESDYLFCFVQSPRFIDRLVSLAHGAHYPAVTDQQVLATEMELPTIEEQRRRSERVICGLAASRFAASACKDQVRLSLLLAENALAECFHEMTPIRSDPAKLPESRKGWIWYSLLDLARLESGHTPSRRHPEWWGGHVPWLALPDIRKLHGKHAYKTTEFTNDAGLANSSARLLPSGTVCLCRDASVGFVTILGRPMATSQHFANWLCDPNKLDPEFLMYAFMASHEYLRQLGSGSVIKTIYMPTIKSFHICVPPIAEQQRVAGMLRERLAAAEALTESLKARLAEVERLPQRVLAAAFGQPG